MSQRITIATGVATLCLALVATSALTAQQQTQGLNLPQASPGASVSQTVGITEIEITYHRPAVNERQIWGGLVPYGQVWRMGANENTLITFSTDVTVEGEALAAGSYGLHAIPGEEEWQIIFSKDTTAWGSFSYDEGRDALRVTVKPQEAPLHRERMVFSFDEVDNEKATVAIHWEKLRVPIRLEVDTHAQTLASIRQELKGLSQFFWTGWNQAANYCLQEEINYEEALEWADRSIQVEERFDNLSTKAQLLEKTGDNEQSGEIMVKAVAMGNAGQLHNYARQLIGQDRKSEALDIFKQNAQKHPDTWFVELGLARGYSALGDFDNAVTNMKISLQKAPEAQKAYVQSLVERLENEEDIN